MEAEERPPAAPAYQPSGGLIRFQSRVGDLGTWVAPAWSTLCGVIASNAFTPHMGDQWLRLAFLLLLTDGAWGSVWSALATTNWASQLASWREWRGGEVGIALPYTRPGTPGHRMATWLAQLHSWWRHGFWPDCGAAVSAVIVAVPIGIAVSVALGPEFLLLGAGALALMQLALGWEAGSGRVSPGWNALITVLLPWVAGHLAFAPLSLPSIGLAAASALAYGLLWSARQPWARPLMIVAYGLSAVLLLLLGAPLAAVAVGVALVPQLALLPWLRPGRASSWYVRHARIWWLAAVLVASWAL